MIAVTMSKANLWGNVGTPFLGPGLWLAGALLLGALLVAIIRRWQRGESSPSASNQLAHFRDLYEKGQISEEEFKRLRSVLGGELRRSLQIPHGQQTPEKPPDALPRPLSTDIQTDTNDPPSTGIKPG